MGCSTKNPARRWQSGIIPYVINPEVTGVTSIYEAFAFWESRTNVRFVRRYLESDYLEFVLDAGAVGYAYSQSIGRTGGRQIIACSFSFNTRIFMHEIGHAIGLIHEQKRSDRDEFVTIHTDNIADGQASQFSKESDTLNSDQYDYRSIMHYSAFSFAKDTTKPTITAIDSNIPNSVLGSSPVPTLQDTAMVNFIYPVNGVIRRSSSQHGAGEINEISSLVTGSRIVTAVRTGGSNRLKMILWNIDALGGIRRLSPIDDPNTAGEASDISCTQAGNNIVVAMRNSGGNLYLISWQFENGKLVRKADSGSLAGEASVVKVISLSDTLLLTACRTGSGDLKLILWWVNQGGVFSRVADSGSQAGAVSEVSLLKLRTINNEHIVSTAVRAGNGELKVITWAVSSVNSTIIRRGDSEGQIGVATQIQSAISPFGHLVLSCKTDGSNKLLLISLNVSPTGRQINRITDTHGKAGAIGVNALVARSYGFVSAVSDGNGNLLLIKWNINSSGQFTRIGDSGSQAGAVSVISLKSFTNNPDAPLCTSVKDGSGNPLLITWDDESQTGELQR
jgi:Astacin (Peptidase family M12A)